jgi:hypothetical protein
VINEGLSEIIGPFPVPSPGDKWERNDDPGQKGGGHRTSEHPSNQTIPVDYRDRRSVNHLARSQASVVNITDLKFADSDQLIRDFGDNHDQLA